MDNSLFFSQIEMTEKNQDLLQGFEAYSNEHQEKQVYLISAPLGEQYSYPYENNVVVILSPKHKIIFIDLENKPEDFEEYYEDFVQDLGYISKKYDYAKYIGRPRIWQRDITAKEVYDDSLSVEQILEKNKLNEGDYRTGELLISLLVGSINDIEKVGAEEPDSILDKVKQNIILFDGDQTRFIYQKFENRTVSIQGLSGTGKTELLLHKLKELYVADKESKIFFTCHNIALANTLKSRIPSFFNFMKVEKQIEWNSRLWVNRAWGSQRYPDSGLYSYICNFYGFTFLRYSPSTDYKKIFTQALEFINKIDPDSFSFAFDYILIDERQDFPKVFFELCEKIAKEKVFIAGDIFQDIFENTKETELAVDVILNRCYRTDPRTLMFAHSVGLGLFESKKLNWFDDEYWQALGYNLNRTEGSQIELTREPIRRFEDLNIEDFESTIIENDTHVKRVVEILKEIKHTHPSVKPEDIAIIILDQSQTIYDYIDTICYNINNELKWDANRAFETKDQAQNGVYITNPNNVKGLEFPFVICVTGSIKNTYRYRNILYTMLTRSFIQSYLLVHKEDGLDSLKTGLKTIQDERVIRTTEPTVQEKKDIDNTLVKLESIKNVSYKEFLAEIFDELEIDYTDRKKLEKALMNTEIERFDKELTVKFIEANREFYS